MNHNQKRYRQISIIESFAFSKKLKTENSSMNEGIEHRDEITEMFPSAKEIKVSSHLELLDSSNVCQVAEDSAVIKIENCDSNAAGTSNLESEKLEVTEPKETDDSFKYSDELFPSQSSLEDPFEESPDPSAPLFSDSEPQSLPGSNESTSDSDEDEDLSILNRKPDCSLPLPKMEPSANHSIMFSPHIRPGDAPRPYPSSYRDRWDVDHVRMPCSPVNRYPVENSFGEKKIESRWDLICRSLRSDIGSSKELEEAIMKYNTQYIGKWNFEGLHAFLNQHLNEVERVHFFEDILPAMVEMALKLPTICTQSVPFLKSGKDHYVTMSQKQIGCLLLNAFFCTFPRRNAVSKRKKWYCEYSTYPDINFNRLYFGVKNSIPQKNAEKLKCLLNYFKRITSAEPSGTVTFHRQCIPVHRMPIWNTSNRGLRTAIIKSSGLIENEGQGMLQVDFANKYVGGGVLGGGCVQEEIRFMICPELIVSRLFVERLDKNEVLIITGVEQYNKYSGYAETFKWEGDFRDNTPRDSWGRRYTELLAMDAISFRSPDDQFKVENLKRELNKAYCGFYDKCPPDHLPAIATGNWGCGAFKGKPNLKFLIQLMAASEAGRSLVYFTFGNKKLKKEMQNMYEFLSEKNLCVGDIWRLLMSYIDNVSLSKQEKICDLYHFIYSQFVIKKENSRKQEEVNSQNQSLNDSEEVAMNKLFEDIPFCGSSTEIEDGT